MKRAIISACAALALLAAGVQAQGPKTPADWVAQLGADNLKDRDAASAALLSLGPKARDAVREGIDSKDAEVQARAKELWKTLRWLVVPDAEEDTKNLVDEAEKGPVDQAHWTSFVQKHGAASLLLVAEFHGSGSADEINEQSRAALCKGGLVAVLDNVLPVDVARLVAQTDNATARARLDAALGELQPAGLPEKTATNWMQIEIALWNYPQAFAFGREFALRGPSRSVVMLCSIAADRGGLFDKIQQDARKDAAAETDAARLCAELSFYTGLFVDMQKKGAVDPLFEVAHADAATAADATSLRRLVETLMSAGMPERAVKVLHNVQSVEGLYMRSSADLQMQNEPTAGADWGDTLTALDALDDAKKKETFYSLGELMHEWHDDRAVVMWQKILNTKPVDTVYDANACFRMGEYLEAQGQFGNAADFYEKGLAISSKITNGVMIATSSDGSATGSGKETVLAKIRELKSRAAGQKSLFNTPPPAVGDGGQ